MNTTEACRVIEQHTDTHGISRWASELHAANQFPDEDEPLSSEDAARLLIAALACSNIGQAVVASSDMGSAELVAVHHLGDVDGMKGWREMPLDTFSTLPRTFLGAVTHEIEGWRNGGSQGAEQIFQITHFSEEFRAAIQGYAHGASDELSIYSAAYGSAGDQPLVGSRRATEQSAHVLRDLGCAMRAPGQIFTSPTPVQASVAVH